MPVDERTFEGRVGRRRNSYRMMLLLAQSGIVLIKVGAGFELKKRVISVSESYRNREESSLPEHGKKDSKKAQNCTPAWTCKTSYYFPVV